MKDYFVSEDSGFFPTTDIIVITEKVFYQFNHEWTVRFCQLGGD